MLRSPLVVLALALAVIPIASFGAACAGTDRTSAAITKPTSPANGAADYKYNPGGPADVPPNPPALKPPGMKEPDTSMVPEAPLDCPPKCGDDGAWIGCGLTKPRGSGCKGCTPKCKGKGTADEGWYDCNGVMIAQRKCS